MGAKDVLIIGASGALGYSTAIEALSAGHRVKALDRNPSSPLIPAGVAAVKGTAESADDVRRAAVECEAVFYCANAPITEWGQKLPLMLGAALDACKSVGARLVFPGNVWIFGKGEPGRKVTKMQTPGPVSRKGRVRLALERMLADSGARHTVVRLPEFYGPNVTNKLMGAPFEAALAGRTVFWYGGHPDVRVEYVFTPDAAKAMVEAGLADGADGETYHVPGHSETTPREFWGEVARQAGRGSRVLTVSPLAVKALRYFSPVVRELDDILHLWSDPILLDGTKYEQKFGSVPRTPYAEGIGRTLRWFADRSHALKAA